MEFVFGDVKLEDFLMCLDVISWLCMRQHDELRCVWCNLHGSNSIDRRTSRNAFFFVAVALSVVCKTQGFCEVYVRILMDVLAQICHEDFVLNSSALLHCSNVQPNLILFESLNIS